MSNGDDLFGVVSVGRASQLIVDQIRELMGQGRLRAGERLPSQRDLCERFAVSRATVRVALRMLQATGLIEVRIGCRGGAFVSPSTPGRYLNAPTAVHSDTPKGKAAGSLVSGSGRDTIRARRN